MRSAVGIVLRDHHGLVIASQALPIAGYCDAGVVEAIAITKGLQLAVELNYLQVMVESDAANVVRQLTSSQLDMSTVGFHLAHARRLLADHMSFQVHVVQPI